MDTPFDSTLESDIKELLKEVPPPVRAVFTNGKLETVAKNLMQKNRLHIDQAAVVERELILLLLGLKDSTEFVQSLVEEANLDKQTLDSIVQEVNTKIFVPLREEMKKAPPPTGVVGPRPSVAPGVVGPPPQSPSYFHLENKIPITRPPTSSASSPTTKGTVSVQRSDLRNVLASVTGEKLLEDHEEPHIEFRKTVPPPQNLPGAILHPPLTPKPPIIPPPTPPKPVSPPVLVAPPPLKVYSADPYREPIE